MKQLRAMRPSPALVVAMIALVAAMSGAAAALPGKSTVNSGDIKDGAVKATDIKDDAVRSKHIKGKSVKGSDVEDDALKGKQILEDKLDAVPEAKTVQTVQLFGDSFERVSGTDGTSALLARQAAPKVALASKGQLSIYAKCFRDSTADELTGAIYIETSADGAIFESSGGDNLIGGPLASDFLNAGTGETDREIELSVVTGPGVDFAHGNNDGWRAMAPDGTALNGLFSIAVKNGGLAGGNGIYGDGNVCLFGGDAIG